MPIFFFANIKLYKIYFQVKSDKNFSNYNKNTTCLFFVITSCCSKSKGREKPLTSLF